MDLRRVLIAALIAVALMDAGTTQIAISFFGAEESNPIQAPFVANPVAGIAIRLASAITVILAVELLVPVWHRLRKDAKITFAPRIDLAAYSLCILGSIPTLAGNLAAIAKPL
jgi:hypothetical protein